MVRSFRRHEQNVQTSLVGREFLGHFLRCFDNPEVEDFALYNEVVLILELVLNCSNVLAGESGYNTVNEGCINTA